MGLAKRLALVIMLLVEEKHRLQELYLKKVKVLLLLMARI